MDRRLTPIPIFSLLQSCLALAVVFTASTRLALPLTAISLWCLGILLNISLPLKKRSPHKPTPANRIQASLNAIKRIVRKIGYTFQSSILGLAACASLATIFFSTQPPFALPPANPARVTFAIAALAALAFAAYLIRVYSQIGKREPTPATRLASRCLDLLIVTNLALLSALLFQTYTGLLIETAIGITLSIITLFWILETFIRWFIRFYQPARIWKLAPALGTTLLFEIASKNKRNTQSEIANDLREHAFRIADMWMLPQVARALPALIICSLTLAWSTTTLHQVELGETGLLRSFGRLSPQTLHPGLHLSLPWPLATVEKTTDSRIESVNLGHISDSHQAILWDKKHYEGEMNLLVGEGSELLTFAVPVFYRISDPYLFKKSTLDPERAIEVSGYQSLTKATLDLAAFDIMTISREQLRKSIKAQIQSDLDQRQTGLEIAAVFLKDIHPPVDVAPSYQEVVSAEEDLEAYIHAGHDYAAKSLPNAQSNHNRIVAQSDALFEERILEANGQAHAFESMISSYRSDRNLFETRSYYAAFDQALAGVKKLISDSRIDQPTTAYVDLRKTLNPDLANTLTPKPQSLIPRGQQRQSTFNNLMDGFRIENDNTYLSEQTSSTDN